MKISSITTEDKNYPYLLSHIYDPPKKFYIWGELPNFDTHPPIAIVGSRKPTEYGIRHAGEIAAEFARAGFSIISGLAYGIDAIAHKSCVKENGKAVAVLGSGFNKLYPAIHKKLAEEIVEKGGAVITEFEADIPPLQHHFPARNRIISGLSFGVVVVEAAIDSGSLITARLAGEQGRDVFAIPGEAGNVNSAGTHKLIKEGAALIENAKDVIEILEQRLPKVWREKKSGHFLGVGGKELKLLDFLGSSPVEVDYLVEAGKFSPAEVVATLSVLECSNLVKRLPDGKYIRQKTHD